jgi:hypothetical protein
VVDIAATKLRNQCFVRCTLGVGALIGVGAAPEAGHFAAKVVRVALGAHPVAGAHLGRGAVAAAAEAELGARVGGARRGATANRVDKGIRVNLGLV